MIGIRYDFALEPYLTLACMELDGLDVPGATPYTTVEFDLERKHIHALTLLGWRHGADLETTVLAIVQQSLDQLRERMAA